MPTPKWIGRRIVLWETASGELRGWSWVHGTELEWYVHPQETDGLLRQASSRLVSRASPGALAPTHEAPVLATWSTTREPELGRLLARAGYEFVRRAT